MKDTKDILVYAAPACDILPVSISGGILLEGSFENLNPEPGEEGW